MDFLDDILKSEISKKKEELKKTSNNLKDSKVKYIKRSELERIREEEYLKEQEKLENARKAKLEALKATNSKVNEEEDGNSSNPNNLLSENDKTIPSLPEEEVIRRLRAKGQPIRLFAETDRSRQIRLRALELIEERSEGQRNDFMQALSAMDTGLNLETLKREHYENNEDNEEEGGDYHSNKKKKDYTFKDVDTTLISLELMNSDIDKLYSLIYVFFKRTIKEWETDMNNRPEDIKRSTAGINAAATQHQTAHYLKPFFKSLKNKDLPPDVLQRLIEICKFIQEREYMKANDSYLRLSIGNAAWPIGVTMVGIHERSAREKISTNSVAHVLNDESQRKWIQSIKRIMTYLQKKYPPADLSKCVG